MIQYVTQIAKDLKLPNKRSLASGMVVLLKHILYLRNSIQNDLKEKVNLNKIETKSLDETLNNVGHIVRLRLRF